MQKDPHPGALSVPISVANGYVYAGNNPINYSDPTGESFLGDLLIGIAIGTAAFFTGGAAAVAFLELMSIATGTVAAFATGAIVGAITGAIAGAVTGAALYGLNGDSPAKGFAVGLIQGAIAGAMAGAAVGWKSPSGATGSAVGQAEETVKATGETSFSDLVNGRGTTAEGFNIRGSNVARDTDLGFRLENRIVPSDSAAMEQLSQIVRGTCKGLTAGMGRMCFYLPPPENVACALLTGSAGIACGAL